MKLYPSGHLLEVFSPYKADEKRMIGIMEQAAKLNFYRNFELPSFEDAGNRKQVRSILESEKIDGSTFVTPYTKAAGLSLCDLDPERRAKTIELVKYHAELAADTGFKTIGIPSGDDPGDEKRPEALKVMTEAMNELATFTAGIGLNLSIEPLDRYTFKKQLIGPIEESCEWFAPIYKEHPNTFIHWDTAHEILGGIDLLKSLDYAKPFLGQLHLCDAIADPDHPCFGDLHMEPAQAPDWTTEGVLKPELAGEIIKKISAFDQIPTVERVYVAVEILGHPGDNLWRKEQVAREFLMKAFELAGVELSRD